MKRSRSRIAANNELPSGMWARVRRWLRPPRRIRATSTGKILLIFTVLLGAAAVNTGNNLLYLILGALFGLISASGILSERSMRNIRVKRSLPGLIFAGTDMELVYEVHNQKRKAHAYLIEIGEEHFPSCERTLFRRLLPLATQARRTTINIRQRGDFHLQAVEVSTRYPFDFYRRSYSIEAVYDGWAAPTPVRHGSAPLDATRAGQRSSKGLVGSRDFDRVRPMADGDSLRHVHWKKTAATGDWMVRDGEQSGGSSVALTLPLGADEAALQNLSWWILDYLTKGRTVLLSLGDESYAIANDGARLRAAMRALALYTTAEQAHA